MFNTLGLDPSVLVSGGCSLTAAPQCPTLPTSTVTVNRKVNTPGGPLDGYEVNFQSPFSFLPGFWSRFGVLANYTHVKSEITYITRVDNPNTAANELLTQTANFTGLSPDAYNLTLYYEDEKVSARVSAAHRSGLSAQRAGRRERPRRHRRRRLDQHRLQRFVQHQQAAACRSRART